MKAIGTLAFGLASVIGICITGASVASYVVAEPEHVPLRKDLLPDLWSVEPRRVDPSSQRFERLPPTLSSYAREEMQRTPSQAMSSPVAASSQETADLLRQELGLAQHQQWCGSKYRSYDPATGTYRSFNGARHACISPDTLRAAARR